LVTVVDLLVAIVLLLGCCKVETIVGYIAMEASVPVLEQLVFAMVGYVLQNT